MCREEVALGWLAQQVDHPVRWLEDCREHLSANANCREHHYQITGYASQDGTLLAIDCIGYVDAGAYSSYPISSAPEVCSQALYFFGLDRSQNLGLREWGHVPNLVEKDRTLVGSHQLALARSVGAGESATLVAE